MSSTRQSILQALRDTRLVDPHSHINPHSPASTTLADILGYHYYTELVHSAGTPKNQIEAKGLAPRELVSRLVPGLKHLTNTAQHAWLIDICQRFFGFEDDVIDESNWESLCDSAESTMRLADWSEVVLEKSNVEAVFLTNDFDDNLAGFDTKTYVPCLRTDDLVFHLSKVEVRDRLAVCTGIDLEGSLKSLRDSLEQRFEHFVSHGARACAISLPPDFSPTPVSDGRASTALDAILRQGPSADASHKAAMARRVFWTIVELCDQFNLPMDLMIGVNRGVYPEGVHQGRDLYDSRVSLIQYRDLFNAFPRVKFPVSVLASVTNQELVSYAWIFPNVITNGHWWYSNTPSFIRRDAAARLEAVPRNKQIGYYSDAYKLEFIAPKFEMYRNILAGILMDDFVIARGWTEEKAIELGQQILRGNVDSIFPDRSSASADIVASDARDDGHASLIASAAAGVATLGLAFNDTPAVEPASYEPTLPDTNSPGIETWIEEASNEPITAEAGANGAEDEGTGEPWLDDVQLDDAELDDVQLDDVQLDDAELVDAELDMPSEEQPSSLESLDKELEADDSLDEHASETLDFEETGIDLNATIDQNSSPWTAMESESKTEEMLPNPDPHSTLEFDSAWANEAIELPADVEATGDDQVDIHSTYVDETLDKELLDEESLDNEPLEFASDDSSELLTLPSDSSGNDIHYFRADEGLQVDETTELNPVDSFEDLSLADDLDSGMFADPTTGELTMPIPAADSDAELDETYLLPDEPDQLEAESIPLDLPSSDDLIDFDDLELSPMPDDDSDLLIDSDEEADEAIGRAEEELTSDRRNQSGEGETLDMPQEPSDPEPIDEQGAMFEFDDEIDFTFDDPEDDPAKP